MRRRAEQIVRLARSNILFYDEHVHGLYDRICALYRMGVKIPKQGKAKQQSGRTKSDRKKRRTRPVSFSADLLVIY